MMVMRLSTMFYAKEADRASCMKSLVEKVARKPAEELS